MKVSKDIFKKLDFTKDFSNLDHMHRSVFEKEQALVLDKIRADKEIRRELEATEIENKFVFLFLNF